MGRMMNPWEYRRFCNILKRFLLHCIAKRRKANRFVIFRGFENDSSNEEWVSSSDALENYIRNKHEMLGTDRIILKMTDSCIKDVNKS